MTQLIVMCVKDHIILYGKMAHVMIHVKTPMLNKWEIQANVPVNLDIIL